MATGFPVVVCFNAGNIEPVIARFRADSAINAASFIICADNDQWKPDKGNPGLDKATQAAQQHGCYIAIPDFTGLDTASKQTDFNDLHLLAGLEAVAKTITIKADDDQATETDSIQAIINELASLSLIEYEQVRKEKTKALSFRPGVLDAAVKEVRKQQEGATDSPVTIDDPFDESVDYSELLHDIEHVINKHMILPSGNSAAVALWIAGTYVYNNFRIFPKLAVISPEKRCGKSTLLDILNGLCCKSLFASNITPSAIFRSIDLWQPTLIIDEADTFLANRNDDLIGIINSGHTKTTAFVIRTVGDDHTPKRFSTWAPMAFASIKGIAGTVMDRSVVIQLKRRTQAEKVARLPVDFKEINATTRQKLVRLADDLGDTLKHCPVEPPEIPNDRAMDNWLPLFTLADAIGGDWPEKVQSAYFSINSMEEEETAAINTMSRCFIIYRTGYMKIYIFMAAIRNGARITVIPRLMVITIKLVLFRLLVSAWGIT